MRMFSAIVLAATLVTLAAVMPTTATAQNTEEPIFASYEEMRSTLDELISKRQIADLLIAFGGADEMSMQDMSGLETQVRNIFPADFENSARIMRQDMENGFSQELVAYWTEAAYIYARLLWHEQPGGEVIAIKMVFNSDPDILIPLF